MVFSRRAGKSGFPGLVQDRRTPYIFHRIRKLVRDQVKNGNYVFSFQMQSLFDASTPGVPHFVYTDHTHLENLNYAANGRGNLYAPEWVALEKEIYRNSFILRYPITANHSPEKTILVKIRHNPKMDSFRKAIATDIHQNIPTEYRSISSVYESLEHMKQDFRYFAIVMEE